MSKALVLLALASCLSAAPASATLITYEWAGTITDNAGITDLPSGAAAQGTISWDTAVPPNNSGFFASPAYERYASAANLFTFNAAGFDFVTQGSGIIDIWTTALGAADDGFFLGCEDVALSPGWSIDHANTTDSYEFNLSGSSNPFPSDSMPLALTAADWNSRQVRLVLTSGVTTPAGAFTGLRVVTASIESLTFVPDGPVPVEATTWSAVKALFR